MSTIEFTAADRARAKKIAGVALSFAMKGDMPEAANYLARLNNSPGLVVAIKGFVDTYIARLHPNHRAGEQLAVVWHDTTTDTRQGADEVRPDVRWAGRLIAARAADDEAGFMALLQTPAQGVELGDGIMALLNIVATSLSSPTLQNREQDQ